MTIKIPEEVIQKVAAAIWLETQNESTTLTWAEMRELAEEDNGGVYSLMRDAIPSQKNEGGE